MGNKASGNNEVTATGNASVAHHIAIRTRTANTNHADLLSTDLVPLSNSIPSKEVRLEGIRSKIPHNVISKKAASPMKNPLFLYAGITYTNIFS
jgi:hypothetical protein